MVPAVIAALFGSSWHLISGTTNAISIVVFASMSALPDSPQLKMVRINGSLFFGEAGQVQGRLQEIDAQNPRLDPEICRACRERIFRQFHIALPNGETRAPGAR